MSEPVRITDHALVRWLERTGAVDVDHLRAILAASLDRAFQAGKTLSAAKFAIRADGLVYVVDDGVLVTVQDDNGVLTHANVFRHGQPETA